jgi:hypothetical protein
VDGGRRSGGPGWSFEPPGLRLRMPERPQRDRSNARPAPIHTARSCRAALVDLPGTSTRQRTASSRWSRSRSGPDRVCWRPDLDRTIAGARRAIAAGRCRRTGSWRPHTPAACASGSRRRTARRRCLDARACRPSRAGSAARVRCGPVVDELVHGVVAVDEQRAPVPAVDPGQVPLPRTRRSGTASSGPVGTVAGRPRSTRSARGASTSRTAEPSVTATKTAKCRSVANRVPSVGRTP